MVVAMADRNVRGARLGAASFETEAGVVFADRQLVRFSCAACGHETSLAFALGVDLPEQWDCRSCGQLAGRVLDDDSVHQVTSVAHVGRTPWEMLLERRSVDELEEILQERLDWLRARRGGSV